MNKSYGDEDTLDINTHGKKFLLHNHPSCSLPSYDDLKAAEKRTYKFGVVACHDGTLIKYQIIDELKFDYQFIVHYLLRYMIRNIMQLNSIILSKD